MDWTHEFEMLPGSKGYAYTPLEDDAEKSPYHSNTLRRNSLKLCAMLCIVTIITLFLTGWFIYPQMFYFLEKESNTIVNVKLGSTNSYLVSDINGNIFTSTFPWLNGSRFKLQKLGSYLSKDSHRYQLKSMVTNQILYCHTVGNVLKANSSQYLTTKPILLDLDPSKHDLDPSDTTYAFFTVYKFSEEAMASSPLHQEVPGGHQVNAIELTSIETINNIHDMETALLIEPLRKFKGVNIGSWFIPERWMDPSFYDGIVEYWSQLCGLVKFGGLELAEERMKKHLDTWLTTEDFNRMVEIGVQSVRIPIGYWNLMETSKHDIHSANSQFSWKTQFVPQDVHMSLRYLDWAVDQADQRGLTVLLDLHGAPGSQNGYDHSGCGYDSTDGEGWNTPLNRNLTLTAIEVLASRYGAANNLLGMWVDR